MGFDEPFNISTPITDVIVHPAFGSFGRLLFPVNKQYYSGTTLEVSDWLIMGLILQKMLKLSTILKMRPKVGIRFFTIFILKKRKL